MDANGNVVKVSEAGAQLLGFFGIMGLPPVLVPVVKEFADLATSVYRRAPQNLETLVALRRLLEAKDAAVRASMPGP